MFVEKLLIFMDEQQRIEIKELIKETLHQQKAESHNFKLGDIVALSSHPFTSSQHDILIGGEPQLISPLMIIVEILRDVQNLYDENVGNQIQGKGGTTAQCKCMWYSSKSFQFEEALISSKLLKKIEDINDFMLKEKDDSGKYKYLQIGTSVTLYTAQLELKKFKSSYKSEGGKEKSSINPLLSFVSPIMQIIGTSKNESKEPLFDAKTGNKKREVSELLIKCKWFNPSSEKMSEKLIPIEALSIIPKVDEDTLDKIATFIEKGDHIVVKYKGRKTIIKPLNIRCIHGFYKLSGYDYLTNKIENFSIGEKLIIPKKNIDKRCIDIVPNVKVNMTHVEQLEAVILKAENDKNYVRIKYKDRNGNVTVRTIEGFETNKSDGSNYLVGKCLLRNDMRNFVISKDKIHFLEVLNLKQPVLK
jgi:hypothetical protein